MTAYPTEPTGRGSEIVQTSPPTCPNGHPLGSRQAHVRYGTPHAEVEHNSTGAGERMLGWTCRTCGVTTWADGSTT